MITVKLMDELLKLDIRLKLVIQKNKFYKMWYLDSPRSIGEEWRKYNIIPCVNFSNDDAIKDALQYQMKSKWQIYKTSILAFIFVQKENLDKIEDFIPKDEDVLYEWDFYQKVIAVEGGEKMLVELAELALEKDCLYAKYGLGGIANAFRSLFETLVQYNSEHFSLAFDFFDAIDLDHVESDLEDIYELMVEKKGWEFVNTQLENYPEVEEYMIDRGLC